MHSPRALGSALVAIGLACATPAHAQPQQATSAGLAAFNGDFATVWDRLLPGVLTSLEAEARRQLAAFEHVEGHTRVTIKQVRRIDADLTRPPGLTAAEAAGVELRVPGAGRWRLELDAVVRVKTKVWFARPTVDVPVRLIVEDLRVVARARFDWTDPDRPRVSQVEPPRVDFKVKLRSRNAFYGLLLRALSPLGNRLAQKAVADALGDLGPTLATLQALPGVIPADGAAPLTDSGQADDLVATIAGIQDKIGPVNMPHGRVVRAIFDTPARDTWADAYGTQGAGPQGTVVGYKDGGDSPIWTGHMLASQAMRYALTGDAQALELCRQGVWGLGTVLDIHGATGLLAREAAPIASLDGQRIAAEPHIRRAMHGELWVSPEVGKISRDQYLGAFMGYSLVHELVPDAALRAECELRLGQMLDYLIAHDWFVDEDRPTWDLLAGTGVFPTFYAGVGSQKLTFLLLAQRILPGRYAAEFLAAAPLAETVWLTAWTSTFDLASYYKFNLSHGTHYLYFTFETDMARWQQMDRARRILHRYVGHHRNAHFGLVQASADPSLRPVHHPEARELLRRVLHRNHRQVAPQVVDLSGVTWQTVHMPVITPPGKTAPPATVTLPTEPIDIVLRKPAGDFIWQRSALTPAQPGEGDPHIEQPGIDLLLPYWMGRYHGAF